MKCYRCIECQERIGREHESLFFVGLEGEDTKPQVEGYEKRERPEGWLIRRLLLEDDRLQQEERPGGHGQDKPQVEVEKQVANIIIPGLRPKNVWSSILPTENVVCHNAPRDHNWCVVEEGINTDLDSENNETANDTIQVAPESLEHVGLTYQGDQPFLDDEGYYKRSCKGPAQQSSYPKPHNARRCFRSAMPVHKRSESESRGVHGEAGRQKCRRRVEEARAEGNNHQEYDPYPWVKDSRYGRVQSNLGCCTNEGQDDPQRIKFQNFAASEKASNFGWNGVDENVRPASDAVLWRVFPRLETVPMGEIMQGFPVIESLVAVLNGGIESC